jgi:hypothetical protein
MPKQERRWLPHYGWSQVISIAAFVASLESVITNPDGRTVRKVPECSVDRYCGHVADDCKDTATD